MIAPPKPPAHDDLEALIPEARQRQRRRQLLAVTGIAVAAGLGLGIYAVAGGFAQSRTSRSAGGPGAVPLCRSSQLSSGYGGFLGASGDVGALIIRNMGNGPCSLLLTPRVAVYLHGKRLPVRQLPANGSVPNSHGETTVKTLGAGKSAYVPFRWSNWCRSPGRATFRYDFGRGLVLRQTWATPDDCAPGSPSTLRVAGPFAG